MKKLILPLFASILFAGNLNYDQTIQDLKQLKETKETDFLIGKTYFEKHLTYTDYIFAFKYLKKSETPESYYYLGKMYQDGLGVEKNIKKAINYYKKSNSPEAKFQLAKYFMYGKDSIQNPMLGLKLLKLSAKKGSNQAQLLLGKLYLTENGFIDEDFEEASKWLYLSAKSGNEEAKKLWNKYKLYRYRNYNKN